jgi:lipoprotein NlpI
VNAQDYGKYSEDLGKANKAIGGVFFVGKSSIRSTDNAATMSFAERLRSLTEEGVKKTTETIAGGKLSGSDLSFAYCDRSLSRGDLGLHEEALQDANEAIRVAPNNTGAFVCRAQAHFKNGQFEKSVTDYSKAIALGATESTMFRERGTSKFAAGRLEEAGSDYAKAYELADNPEAKTLSGIWLAITYGRLGKPLPQPLLTFAAAGKAGGWPRPALAMLTGALSSQELIKLMDEKKGDDRQMALSEGYFYMAERSLALGDHEEARRYLEKSREQQVIVYTEHTVAGYELQRLTDVTKPATSAAPKRAVAD